MTPAYRLALLELLTLRRTAARWRRNVDRQDRDDAIRACLAAQVPPVAIAEAAGLTVARVHQIRRAAR